MSASNIKVVKKKSYFDMVKEALVALQAPRTGISRYFIAKYIIDTYGLDEKLVGKHLKNALKEGVETGKLTQVTGVGANGSFKLSDQLKKEEAKATKAAEKKADKENVEPVAKKTKVSAKAAAVKKPAAKSSEGEEATVSKNTLIKIAVKKAPTKKDSI